MFDANLLKTEIFIKKTVNLIDNLNFYRKKVEHSINKILPTIEIPFKKIINLSN